LDDHHKIGLINGKPEEGRGRGAAKLNQNRPSTLVSFAESMLLAEVKLAEK